MDTSKNVKLEIIYYYKICESSPEEPTKVAKKKVVFHFPPDQLCHEVHKTLRNYTKNKAVLLVDGKCMLGGTVEKNLMGKKLVMFNKETVEEILLKEDFGPQQEFKKITTEDVLALREKYYSS